MSSKSVLVTLFFIWLFYYFRSRVMWSLIQILWLNWTGPFHSFLTKLQWCRIGYCYNLVNVITFSGLKYFRQIVWQFVYLSFPYFLLKWRKNYLRNLNLSKNNYTFIKQGNTFNKFALVNGVWSAFGNWSDCSSTCGISFKVQTRSCNEPEPKYGGQPCQGSSNNTLPCTVPSCPGKFYLNYNLSKLKQRNLA